MKIGMITDSLPDTDFDAMLAVAARLEMDMLEFACGNWSSAPHIKLDAMLESATDAARFPRAPRRSRHRHQRAQLFRQSAASRAKPAGGTTRSRARPSGSRACSTSTAS